MKLFFCESCGKRVTDLDIQAGKASDKLLAGVYCSACAQGVTTQTDLPVADAPPPRDSKKKIKPPPRRASSAQPAPVPPAARVRRVSPIEPAESGWDPRILLSAAAGVVLLLLGGILVFGGSSSSAPRAKKGEPAEAPQLPAPESVASRPPGGLSSLTPPKDRTAPTSQPVRTDLKPPEDENGPNRNAEMRRLEGVLRFEGIPPGDKEARKAKLAEFISSCKVSGVVQRARSILALLKEPEQAEGRAEVLHHQRFEEGMGDWESESATEFGTFEGLKCLKVGGLPNGFMHVQLPVPWPDSDGLRVRVEYFLNGAQNPTFRFVGTKMNRDLRAEPWQEGEWAWATISTSQAHFSGAMKSIKFFARQSGEGGHMLVRQAVVERLTATTAPSQAADAQPNPSAPPESISTQAPPSLIAKIISETHFEHGLGEWVCDSSSKAEPWTADGTPCVKVSTGDRTCRVLLPLNLPDTEGVRVRFEYRFVHAKDPAVEFCREGFRKAHVFGKWQSEKWTWAEVSAQQAGFAGALKHIEIAATPTRGYGILMLRQAIVERVVVGEHKPSTAPAETAMPVEAAPALPSHREAFLRLLAEGSLARAEALLAQAEAGALPDERKAELALDRKALGWAQDLETAVEAGVGKLNETERFELRLLKGLPVLVGTATNGRVAQFKDGKLAVTSDKLGLEILLADLDEETLRELAHLGLGQDAGGFLRRAFAFVLDRLRGKGDRTKEAQQALDVARRLGAQEAEVAYLAQCLRVQRSEAPVQPQPKAVVAREEEVRAPGVLGEFFKDKDFKELGFKRADRRIHFSWNGSPAPGIPDDNFSVRWSGMLRAESTGEYDFSFSIRGMMRMKLDGKWVRGSGSVFLSDNEEDNFTLHLTEGWHPMVVELVENSRSSRIVMRWRKSGANNYSYIGVENLSHMTRATPAAPDAASPRADLVAHWTFDEAKGQGFFDTTRLGHFGNLRNMQRQNGWSPEGVLKSKSAVVFDGVDDYGEVDHKDDLNVFPMTLSLWFKRSGNPKQACLVNKYKPGSSDGYRLLVLNHRLRVQYGGGEGDCIADDAYGVDAGRVNMDCWHHVAMCVDESGLKVYVDGEERAAKAWPRAPKAPSNTEPLLIGSNARYFFEGQLDDVRVYKGALSAAEVQALAAKSEGNNRLLLHWPFEGVSLKDHSGNGRDGTLNKWHSIINGFHARAVRFSGAEHYAQLAHDNALNAFPLSVSVFLRLTGPGRKFGALACKYVHNSENGWAITWDCKDKVLKGHYCRDANNRIRPHHYASALEMDRWYHVVYCVEERGARFVIDGKPGDWQPWIGTPGPPTNACEFTIGRYGGMEDSCLEGDLDELRVYQGTLSDADIQELGKP